jgi:hypothetical protein
LGDIAYTAASMADERKDPALLEQTRQVAKEIDDPQEKARTLKEIARTATKRPAKMEELALLGHVLLEHIKQTLQLAKRESRYIWHDFTDTFIEATFENALKIVAKTGDLRGPEDERQLAKALQEDPWNGTFLLNFAAEVAAKMPAKIKKHSGLLHLLSRLTNELDIAGLKTIALGVAAEHAAGIGDVKQAAAFLAQARQVAEGINESKDKARTLRKIALATASMAAETKAV